MSNVYIIGNGFDLNLGLKTSYKDFMKSEFFANKNDDSNDLFSYLARIDSNSNWIDIEKELVEYSKHHSNSFFLKEYKELCETLKCYMKSIDISKMNRDSFAYNLLSSTESDDPIFIINFNYTNSIAHILSSAMYDEHDNSEIMNIHGCVKSNQIIFGVDDRANINKDHTFLYKSTSPIYNGRKCISALRSFEKLHIMGHSLGESDHMYLGFFGEISVYDQDHHKEINIYHYGEEDNYKIHKQLHRLTQGQVSRLKNNTNVQIIDLKK